MTSGPIPDLEMVIIEAAESEGVADSLNASLRMLRELTLPNPNDPVSRGLERARHG